MKQRPKRAGHVTPGPARGAIRAEPSVLQLQRAAGNRAVSALIARVPTGGAKAGSTIRKIVIDANVFDQLARGNEAAAKTLRQLAKSHEVYVAWQVVQEWMIRSGNPKQTNAVRRIIEVLGLKIAPPAPAAVLAEVTKGNAVTIGRGAKARAATILSKNTDVNVAAEAKALNAEVWSFDSTFKTKAKDIEKKMGVKIAPETQTVEFTRGTKPDQTRALRILGIEEDAAAGHLPAGKEPVKPAGPAGGGAKEAEKAGGKATEKAAVKEGGQAAGSTAGKAAVKDGGQAAGKAAVKEAEHAAGSAVGKAAAKSGKLAAKIGMAIVDGLIPDPLDAIGLMIDFAGSYAEAWDNIKRSNRTSGFAMGLAAYLVVPRWEWARQFAYTTVSRDVVTEVLGAAGIAENAFNDGLVRGFLYGEKHSDAQANKLRQKAFNTLRLLDRTPGYVVQEETDTEGEVRQFGKDDVVTFASVLLPTANYVLVEAERRREAAIAAKKAREDIERWKRPPTVGYKL